jgi:hypothetical protein
MDIGMDVSVGVGMDCGVSVAVGSWTLIGVRVAVGSGVAVGGSVGGIVGGSVGGTVGVAVGGGVGVASGLGVLVGVGVEGGEGLQPLRRGSTNSQVMAKRERTAPFLEAILTPIMIVLTSGKRFRVAGQLYYSTFAPIRPLFSGCEHSWKNDLTMTLRQARISNLDP